METKAIHARIEPKVYKILQEYCKSTGVKQKVFIEMAIKEKLYAERSTVKR